MALSNCYLLFEHAFEQSSKTFQYVAGQATHQRGTRLAQRLPLSPQRFARRDDGQKQKSLHEGGLGATFRFFSYAQSLLKSGAKVKKETKNSCVHDCGTLSMIAHQ
ncbi:hypothetical protein DMW62_01645 [Serratia marcescens]|uniref:Uncharacterized protein n=1 Tax=Serratia marcescens TaxID=615 RepID=A0AAP8PJH6_SERMA|nr:hypothetical protein C3F38_13210 [Serratia sp. SSNIH1]AWL66830.1 hypothetical protein DKC05_03660 [Serratia marcescens]PJI68161.1 hypothetical protein CUN64_11810 [Serratia sp. TKO39]POU55854.1 hypothetical protein C3401_06185 [Serratia sp. SSNIH4]POW40974.1 hypothetical protein C3414_07270 [Serratia sp. SSNIH2]POW41418.1 hypothetical protein C3396_06000 [Serratia sp. SSNIH5]POW62803.1 hypothetical protein C3403_06790 [Serratia sp. SSNIH3]